MWIVMTREAPPDAPYWPGRRLLAVLDAALWPAAWVLLVNQAPKPVGLVGPMVAAVALLLAVARVNRAIWVNHRYRFTTWRWGKVVAGLWLIGLVLKLSLER